MFLDFYWINLNLKCFSYIIVPQVTIKWIQDRYTEQRKDPGKSYRIIAYSSATKRDWDGWSTKSQKRQEIVEENVKTTSQSTGRTPRLKMRYTWKINLLENIMKICSTENKSDTVSLDHDSSLSIALTFLTTFSSKPK